MVTGDEECSCTDTTEPSNVTSLHSDDIASAVNSYINTVCKNTETINEKNDVKLLRKTDSKCPLDELPITNYCEDATTEAVKPDRQLQQKNSRNQSPVTTARFKSSFSCLCHSHKINGYILPMRLKEVSLDIEMKKGIIHISEKAASLIHSRQFWSRFKWKKLRNGYDKEDKMYEIKLKQTPCPYYAKMRYVNGVHKQQLGASSKFQPFDCCEISEKMQTKSDKSYDLPKPKTSKYQAKIKSKKEEAMEKIEIYYFDHGNSAYYRTTDCHPILTTEKCIEKTDQAATRFWAEIFGTIHIGTAFVTAFILQLLRFVLYSIIRPLVVGIPQLIADYFVKPLLSITFNAIIQPVLILLYNTAKSLRDLCEPIAEATGLFLREIANLCAAIRIIEVKNVRTSTTACT